MNDDAVAALTAILAAEGTGVIDEPRRLAALLADRLAGHRLELNLLTDALEEGVPEALLRGSEPTPTEATYQRLAGQLREGRGFDEEKAQWAVSAWTAALGLGPRKPAAAAASLESAAAPMEAPGGDVTWAAPPSPPAASPPAPPEAAAAGSGGVPPRRSRRMAFIAGLLAVAVVGLAVALFAGGGKKNTPRRGEIFLQPAAATGANPYTPSVATVTPSAAPATVAPPSAAPSTVAVAGQSGATAGLYGGTRDQSSCNPQQMVAFLQQNPDKANAWVQAMNSDPTFRWSGGTQLSVDQIPQYVAELTPVILREDTRVTNHGFLNGGPTTLQSVLQAGTAILVDTSGVPRVRCACGNPLAPPIPVPEAPSYTGEAWPGFTPTTVVVVVPPPTVINVFTLVDTANPADAFDRPAGTTGTADTPDVPFTPAGPTPTPTVLAESASPTPTPSPSPSPTPAGTPSPNVDITKDGSVAASTTTPGYPASLAIDSDPTTSWFSTGAGDGNDTSVFTWTGKRDDLITLVQVAGNQANANASFRSGFGFGETTVQVLDAAGKVVFSQDPPGPNDQAQVVTVHPGVVGRSVRLLLHKHLNPTCGGFSELKVGATR